MSGALKRNADEILDAVESAAQRFKHALKNRQSAQARAIRDHNRAIRDKDGELGDISTRHNPNGSRYRRSEGSKGEYGERQTAARMDELGYSRISAPGKNPNSNGIDDIFIHRDTGHVMIVESKYGTSRLGRLIDGTRQMSNRWLTRNDFRSNPAQSRIDVAMNHPTAPLSGPQVTSGLREDLVSAAVSRVDSAGGVSISFL